MLITTFLISTLPRKLPNTVFKKVSFEGIQMILLNSGFVKSLSYMSSGRL